MLPLIPTAHLHSFNCLTRMRTTHCVGASGLALVPGATYEIIAHLKARCPLLILFLKLEFGRHSFVVGQLILAKHGYSSNFQCDELEDEDCTALVRAVTVFLYLKLLCKAFC